MPNEDNEPKMIPKEYTQRKLWQFLLDTKPDTPYPDQPRFKQFAENLRNFAVTGAILKAAQSIGFSLQHPFLSVGHSLLIIIGISATLLCALQQFGLLLIAFHWYLPWTVHDGVALMRMPELRARYKAAGVSDGRRLALMKLTVIMVLPILFLWAMLSFVLSSSH